jgi:hypothetical protein
VDGLFVEIATHDLLQEGGTGTDSRISLLTGRHRKEIRWLRLKSPDDETIPEVTTISSQTISTWLDEKQFSDADGGPLVLPRQKPDDGGPSFETLVEAVTIDVRPQAVLDDFLSQGIVTLIPGDFVRIN